MATKTVIIEEREKKPTGPPYTLHYFNFKGRAEVTRLILAYAGVQYDDHRVADEKEWKKFNQKTPFGQLPVLELNTNSKMLSQSKSIARFLARKHRLVGKDAWESAQADMLVDYISDVTTACYPALAEENSFKKKTVIEKATKTVLRPFFENIERILKDNGNGFLVGNQMTWADLFLFTFLDLTTLIDSKMADSYANVIKLRDRVADYPLIKAWLVIRPATSF